MSTYRHTFSSLAAAARRPTRPSGSFRLASVAVRNMHQLQQLPYSIENGLGGFLTPEALRVIAVDYQSGLLERLNDEVRGTELENLSVAQTVISATKQQILAFNYASQALNNSFFLDNLKPPIEDDPNHEKDISPELRGLIYESFDDLEGLKSYMSAAALGMTGSGWVWLVVDMTIKSLAVVATYGPGTMLVRSRQYRHPNGIHPEDLLPRPFSVLGEEQVPQARAGSTRTAHTIGGVDPPPTSPTSGAAHRVPDARPRPQHRRFSTSLPPYHPLNLTHRLCIQPSPSSSTIQFSQTPLAWHQPLEPLSKKNSSTSAGDLLTPSSQYSPGAETEEEADFDDPSAPPLPQWNVTPSELVGGTNYSKQLGTAKLLRRAGDDLSPLMCISVHEHTWMSAGLGVWGKEEYLRRFWSVVDWRKVSKVYRLWETRDAVFRTERE